MADKNHPDKRVLNSGIEIKTVYTPKDLEGFSNENDLGSPGEYPFTRGIYPLMYRSQPWMMNQYAGFATAQDTNARFRFLLERGQTGLNVAFDLPTQNGYDSDDPRSEDEVGRVGVAVDTLQDMEEIFDGIPIDKVRTHFTINSMAPVILAMYVAVAEKQKVPLENMVGTLQNDILKEFVARGTWVFPPEPSVRLVGDIIEYCTRSLPKFNPISVSGSHMHEAGSTSVQEVAFTFLNGLSYVDEACKRGLHVDDFVPKFTFLMCCRENFFEEICKFRAARRLWARIMKDQYGAQNPQSMRVKCSGGGGGRAMTKKEPLNNIARIGWIGMASVLGGCQSMTLAQYDECFAIPTAEAARVTLRIQQMMAYEIGIADTVDPLAGSYFVENLTNKIEEEARILMKKILDQEGSMVSAIQKGVIQRIIAREAYLEEKRILTGEKVKVGLNKFVDEEAGDEEEGLKIHEYDPTTRERQINKMDKIKRERDQEKVIRTLDDLRLAAEKKVNLMPSLLDTVKAYATLGEIVTILKKVYGEFKEPTGL
ncbi:MAG: methylmalonyl-CoA mutase [Candidatus Tectomicrobia bacterium]|uniref:Methylmalonyl-CoA mutase n=1 Tax=Tectimicrobiota bacterium TaxID=2528274 RepID=A0A933GLD7_UNCTE|nr:methylmalonyl-CoA mutase [Candidatus Tectomicrobia bacterium]